MRWCWGPWGPLSQLLPVLVLALPSDSNFVGSRVPAIPALPPAWPPPQAGTNLFTALRGPYVYYRIPAVAHFADRGIVLLFVEARNTLPTSPDPDQGFIDIVMRRSDDGLGARWGPQALVHSESNATHNVTIGNPAPVVVSRQPGKVVLTFCRGNTAVLAMDSTDYGRTFSTPRELHAAKLPGWSSRGRVWH
jgi:hypothetical protein